MSDNLIYQVYNLINEAVEARAKWLESEINKSIIKEGLQHFSIPHQVEMLKAIGYQQRQYTYNTKITWGQVVLGEFMPIAEFDVEYVNKSM